MWMQWIVPATPMARINEDHPLLPSGRTNAFASVRSDIAWHAVSHQSRNKQTAGIGQKNSIMVKMATIEVHDGFPRLIATPYSTTTNPSSIPMTK